MHRRFAVLAMSLLILAALGGSASAATTITVGNNFFAPAGKTIAAGTKVNFRWSGGERHNVKKTRGPGTAFKSATARTPGVHFSRRFRQRGAYRMICTIHPFEMKLRLTVE